MAAHQAPPSLGFSRQEHWSGLPFPLQCMKVKSESEVAQLCQTLCDSMDCSLPGSFTHGIFQARVLEWGAIAFDVYSVAQHNSKHKWVPHVLPHATLTVVWLFHWQMRERKPREIKVFKVTYPSEGQKLNLVTAEILILMLCSYFYTFLKYY